MIEEFDPNDIISVFPDDVPTPRMNRVSRKMPASQEAFIRTAKIFAPAVLGLILIWFGLTSTGSYYMTATRFGGVLADIWYGWQFGTLLAMIGAILIYDAVKRSGYL